MTRKTQLVSRAPYDAAWRANQQFGEPKRRPRNSAAPRAPEFDPQPAVHHVARTLVQTGVSPQNALAQAAVTVATLMGVAGAAFAAPAPAPSALPVPAIPGALAPGLPTPWVVPLTTYGQGLYYAKQQVGNESTHTWVDSGSSDVLIQQRNGQPLNGSTPEPNALLYGGGAMAGTTYNTTVSAEGLPAVETVAMQVTRSNFDFPPLVNDGYPAAEELFGGIWGFGGPAGAAIGGAYIDVLHNQTGTKPIVTTQFCQFGGHLMLGAGDTAHHTGDWHYTPMHGASPYALNVSGVAIGDTALPWTEQASFNPPYEDSGEPRIMLPQLIFDAARAAINPVAGNYFDDFDVGNTFSCWAPRGANRTTLDVLLPPLRLTFPGMAPQTYFTRTHPATQSYLSPRTINGTLQYCSMLEGKEQFILGASGQIADNVRRDLEGQRIGFATNNQATCPQEAPPAP